MLVISFSVLVTCITIFTSAEVIETRMSVHEISLDGLVSNEHLLFQEDATAVLECAAACMKSGACVAFSTSTVDPLSKKMTCRGHDSKSVVQTSTVALQGSKTYLMGNQPSASTWLERPCAVDSDCPATVANVVCFAEASQCLCQVGYFYSKSRDACVLNCAQRDLQSTFLLYPTLSIFDNNMANVKNCSTFDEGQQRCLNIAGCVTFDINLLSNMCFPQSVTAMNPGIELRTRDIYLHYQRTCL